MSTKDSARRRKDASRTFLRFRARSAEAALQRLITEVDDIGIGAHSLGINNADPTWREPDQLAAHVTNTLEIAGVLLSELGVVIAAPTRRRRNP